MEETDAAYQAGYEMGYAVGGLIGCVLMIAIPVLFIVSLILAIVKKSKGWTIAAVISGLLGLGLIGVSAFMAFKGVSEAIEESGNPKVLQGAEGTFEITVPGHWSEQDLQTPDASLQAGNLFREEYLVVIHEPKADFDPDFTIDDYAEVIGDIVSEGTENIDRGQVSTLEIQGLPARRYRLEGSVDGIRIVYLMTFVETADRFYQLMMWTLPSKEEAAFAHFEEAAANFRPLNGENSATAPATAAEEAQ